MSEFRLGAFPSSSVLYVYSLRSSIWFDPPYQRLGDIWPLDKRQLLVDSLINGYDIPKLYFHEFFPPKRIGTSEYRYAIVDGKQRMQSIFQFIEGAFPLGDKVEYLADEDVNISGLTYKELAQQFPDIKTRFDGCVLPIVTIQTEEVELIEDMFSRLNEAVPLNAAEKRNALGGPLPPLIRQMASLPFFTKRLPFTNRRFRHLELAAKFLHFQHTRKITDTKKRHLDDFVRKLTNSAEAKRLFDRAQVALDRMHAMFVDRDELLQSAGTVFLYYLLANASSRPGKKKQLTRGALVKFERARLKNRELAEKGSDKVDLRLLEFDRLAQSPNDAFAIDFRYRVLKEHLGI